MKRLMFVKDDDSYITVNNKKYRANITFKNVMKSIQLLEDRRFNNFDRVYILSRIFCNEEEFPQSLEEQAMYVDKVFDIIRGEDGISKSYDSGLYFDWFEDAEKIYTSFKTYADIDLIDDDISWSKFNAIFKNLGEDTPMMEALMYRTMPVPKESEVGKERVKFIRAKKEYYMLDKQKEHIMKQKEKHMERLFDF